MQKQIQIQKRNDGLTILHHYLLILIHKNIKHKQEYKYKTKKGMVAYSYKGLLNCTKANTNKSKNTNTNTSLHHNSPSSYDQEKNLTSSDVAKI